MFGIIKTFAKELFTYRLEMIMSLLIMPIKFLIMIIVWTALYSNNSTSIIAGYSLENLITYFILSSIVIVLISDWTTWTIQDHIREGGFVSLLVKPYSYLKYLFLNKIGSKFVNLFVQIIPLLIILVLFFRKYFISGNVLLFTIAIIFSFIMYYFINFIVGLFAFWLVSVNSLQWITRFAIELLAGGLVPITLFPNFLQKALDYLPFKYLIFSPIEIYLGKYTTNFSNGFTNSVYFVYLMQILWCVVLYIIIKLMYKQAIKRFSGVGV
ncbi:MAG: ABC-2 family transporter protein [archaeon]